MNPMKRNCRWQCRRKHSTELWRGLDAHPVRGSFSALHLWPQLREHLVAAVDGSGAVTAGEGGELGHGDVGSHIEHHSRDVDEGDEEQHAVAAEEEGEQQEGKLLQECGRVAAPLDARGAKFHFAVAHVTPQGSSAAEARGAPGRQRGRRGVDDDMAVPVLNQTWRAAEHMHVILSVLHQRMRGAHPPSSICQLQSSNSQSRPQNAHNNLLPPLFLQTNSNSKNRFPQSLN